MIPKTWENLEIRVYENKTEVLYFSKCSCEPSLSKITPNILKKNDLHGKAN